MRDSTCFVHVPKSGGSTVVAALRASLDGGVFHAHERPHRAIPLEYLLSRYAVVAGHFTFAQLSPAILRNAFVFTVLREPVDRAISLYSFFRAQGPTARSDARVSLAQACELPAFVERLRDRISPWSNWQTFVFSGARDCEQPAHELLPAAMENLKRMTLVGVSDDLDALIQRVGELRGWPLRPPHRRMNTTSGRLRIEQIDAPVLDRLAELNDCDRRLFAWARTLWDRTKATPVQARGVAADEPSTALRPTTSARGTEEIVVTAIRVAGEPSHRARIYVGDGFEIDITGYSRLAATDVTIGIRIDDHLGIEVYGVNTRLLQLGLALTAGQTFGVTFSLNAHLAPGIYYVTVAIHAGPDHLHRCYHWIDNAIAFECLPRHHVMHSGTNDLQATATFGSG